MQNFKTRLLNRRQVQHVCGMSQSLLERLMRSGYFPAPLQVGPKTVRWRLDEILAWLEACEREVRGEPPKAKGGTSCR